MGDKGDLYRRAGELYNDLYTLTLNLAEAADSHSAVPFEFDEVLCTSGEEEYKRHLTDSTADDRMRLYSYFLSQTWKEANEFFNGEMSTKLKGDFLEDEVDWDRYDRIIEDYNGLTMDILQLDAAVGNLLERTPTDDPEEFRSEELVHKGPGLVK
ncbi:MAG: hypothetical protein ABEK16_03360 [Candidatus Nanohalobium sp.]